MMETIIATTQSTPQHLLFDDRLLLETALGKDAFNVSAINANCDCDAYYNPQTDENFNTCQITSFAASAD